MRQRVASARQATSAARLALHESTRHTPRHRPSKTAVEVRTPAASDGASAEAADALSHAPASRATELDPATAAKLEAEIAHLRSEMLSAQQAIKQMREREVALKGVLYAVLPQPQRKKEA